MKIHKYTEAEVKLTAILYATREDVVRNINESGKLPENIPLGGFPTAMNMIIRKRGLTPALTEDEQLIYKAIQSEKILPGGGVILVEDTFPIFSLELGQHIEICPPPRQIEWED